MDDGKDDICNTVHSLQYNIPWIEGNAYLIIGYIPVFLLPFCCNLITGLFPKKFLRYRCRIQFLQGIFYNPSNHGWLRLWFRLHGMVRLECDWCQIVFLLSNKGNGNLQKLLVNALIGCHDLDLSCCHEIARISVMECSL